MTIHFSNRSGHIVILCVDDREPQILQPFSTISMVRNDSDSVKVSVRRDSESYVSKKAFWSAMYHLTLETEYIISGISEGEVFNITREKIQFSLNSFYDRLFLFSQNTLYYSETHKVVSEDRMKKAFNRYWRREQFYFEPFGPFHFITFPVFLIVGAFFTFVFGWIAAVVYFPTIYLTLLMIKKVWDWVFKKGFNMDNEKKEFYSYFNNESILRYYADVNRTPFSGGVEN